MPVSFTTGVRIHSSVETRLPAGTSSVPISSRRVCTGVGATTAALISSSVDSCTSRTSRANVVIPGSCTRFSIR
ncbi:hypothetical protein SAMN05444920_13164 [Nonomuraea solani]|uniref:Uncharacterized protein n=1 Tax=Nonomuraea solani TaxID=1144553 RepID=A0A1H6EYT5_9ACTN|nr:hypothetical protein SAMN05444920_13164 [Nonomuraea solani]